jgi:hypothetical protein
MLVNANPSQTLLPNVYKTQQDCPIVWFQIKSCPQLVLLTLYRPHLKNPKLKMPGSSLCGKVHSILGHKPRPLGPAHPDSYPVYITHDLVSAAMNAVVNESTAWLRDPEYRIEVVMVKAPLQYCPLHIANAMPPGCTDRHPYAVAIAKARFHRTPEHPGGELTEIAMVEWNEMAVTFSLAPREFVTVVPLKDTTHKNQGTK